MILKVLLYFENQNLISRSGIGRALNLQREALSSVGVTTTTNFLEEDYDVLHINTYGIGSRKIIRKARKLKKPVIYHAHSTYEDFKNSFIGSNLIAPFYKKRLISLYNLADEIITPTEYSKKLLENYGITKKIFPLSNGIDLERYKTDPIKQKKFRDFFNLSNDQKIIISVGLLFERKGIFDFAELARRNPDKTFIWFGSTSLGGLPLKNRELVKFDKPKNLLFPGYINGDIILGAFQSSDLFLYPSFEETEGIVVLEALASKQNVLLRDIPVYEGWLENEKNVYKAKNIDEFNVKLNEIVNKKVPNLTKEGYKTVQERKTEIIGENLKVIYENLLEKRNNKTQ